MDNFFIAEDHFDWTNGGSRKMRLAARLLRALGFGVRLRATGSTGQMTNLEQRINLYHLLSQVLAYGVRGDIIEVGTYTGETAVMLQWVLDREGPERVLHVYDSFGHSWGSPDPLEQLKKNFQQHCGKLPQIHRGLFDQTLPAQLPEQIAFMNLDCGWGGPAEEHARTLEFVLGQVYPRMPRGAICSLIDYWDPARAGEVNHTNPGVRLGVDRFLAGKPEKVLMLYSGEYSQAYFRKQ